MSSTASGVTRGFGVPAAALHDARRDARQAAPLSRERVLDAALRLVDAEGAEALSMRRLGAELGVEAMSLYNYFSSKDALLDGLVERLWAEVRPAAAADWRATARATADALRGLARRHPRAYPLLLTRCALPEPALRALDALLTSLRGAGFDEGPAAEALRTLLAYALGYAMVEATCAFGQADVTATCHVPPDAARRFPGVVRALEECDPDAHFKLGVETVLDGLEIRRAAR